MRGKEKGQRCARQYKEEIMGRSTHIVKFERVQSNIRKS